MAIVDLASYSSIYAALFVRMDIPNYEVLRYSTHFAPFSVTESDNTTHSYTNLGTLVGVTDNTFGIRTNPEEITITISGVPLTNVSMVLAESIKGSRVEVRRQFFTGNDYTPINTPIVKFKGIINNYNVVESWPDSSTRVGTCTISFQCSTLIDLMSDKRSGRRTNPMDEKSFFPNDLSMDRVPTLSGSSFNFGAPK